MFNKSFSLLVAVGLGAIVSAAQGAEPSYRLTKEIAVGGDGGWDYLSIDEAARRLYVSHATKIVVLDIDKNEVVGEIADTPGIHGIAIAHELGRGFSSNGKENKSSIVDLKSLKTLSKVDTGENPDAILYEPGAKEVYTFNGRGKSATVFDAKSGKVIATIPLSGKPEFATEDLNAGRIFCNIEDKNEVAVIDTKTHKVINTWPIAPGEAASGMAIDVAHHRLFLGCDNKLMVMMDNTNGKVITTVPIGDRVDANAFDPVTQLVFSSNGEGTVTIAREESPEKLTVIQTLKTEPGAKTMTLDPKTHNIYLASAKFEKPTEQGGARQRPKMIPGTFKVLVYSLVK
ncbi:MAG: beta-propeller repeat-containing protein [Verrucomicrobiales bacterium]|nr:beta-propeller repeat-containing protein [Verrucomicrobiales bacterium]